jgi:phosphoribosylamine--glycine ligase
MELDRKFASDIARACGLLVPEVWEVKDLEDAKRIIKETGGKKVLKQQGKLDGIKGLNYCAKMENSEDLIAHIENLQEKWIPEIKQDFVLQEKIEGWEMAIGSFWSGNGFQTDKEGFEVIEENFEHKPLFSGNLGPQTGEQFTVQRMMRASSSKLFKETLDKIRPALLKTDFRGDFDINTIVTEKGAYFLEFTPRMGVPAQSGLMSIQKTKWGEFLLRVAKGEPTELEYDPRWCIVSWLYTAPFPAIHEEKEIKGSVFEKVTNNISNSKGIKVLFKEKLTKEDWNNLHFDAVRFDGKDIIVANSDGFILTACGLGETVDEAGDKVEKLLKKMVVPKGFWRNDFHDTNYHKAKKDLIKWGYLQDDSTIEEQLAEKAKQEEKDKQTKEITEKIQGDYDKKLSDIKGAVKGIIYGNK